MAKKPSPAELKKEGVELGKTLAAMRKAEHNIALQLGKDGVVFVADKRKAAEVLWRTAKGAGGSSKGVMGTAIMNGKVIEIDCDDPDQAPAGITRKAKIYFAERGHSVKVLFKGEEDPDAETEAADADEGAAGGGAQTQGGAAADDGGADGGSQGDDAAAGKGESELEVLRREFAEFEPDIDLLLGSENKGLAKKVGGLKTMFEGQIEANQKKAKAVLGLIQTTLQTARDAGDLAEGGPAGGGPDPAVAEERRSKIADLERSVDELLAEFA